MLGASNRSPMFRLVIQKNTSLIVGHFIMARGLQRKIAKKWNSGVHAAYMTLNCSILRCASLC